MVFCVQRGSAGFRYGRGAGGLGRGADPAEQGARLQQLQAPRGRLQRHLWPRPGGGEGGCDAVYGGGWQDHTAQHQDRQVHRYTGMGTILKTIVC